MSPSSSTTARRWAYASLFGTLWGVTEITVGSFIHALRIPFGGAVLAILGAALLVAERHLLPCRGLSLATAVVAAVCRGFFPTGAILPCLVAIIMEGVLVEGTLTVFGSGLVGGGLAGGVAALWAVVQKAFMLYLLYGAELVTVLAGTLTPLGLAGTGGAIGQVGIALLCGLVFLTGVGGGIAGTRLGAAARRRLAEPGNQG